MNIPSIGGARGIFEIFIPGVFLFLNILLFTYYFPEISGSFKNNLISLASNQILSLVVLISFGYLIGVILRLLKTRRTDKISGFLCWMWYGKFQSDKKDLWIEAFPYFIYLSKLTTNKLPNEANSFYEKVWKPGQGQFKDGNREFFNYCKMLISAKKEQIANDIYSSEALTRYVSGMFYALSGSLFLMFVLLISTNFDIFWLIIIISYIIAILIILLNFRFLRAKEVETVFVAMLSQSSKKYKKQIL